MKYYCIEIRKKNEDPNEQFGVITNLIAVNNENEYKDYIKECVEEFDMVNNYNDDSYEVTETEAILRLEESMKARRIKSYMKRNNYDELSLREYSNHRKELNTNEGYFKVLKDEENVSSLRSTLSKHYDLSKISVLDFEELVLRLRYAKTDEEFAEIASKLVKKERE